LFFILIEATLFEKELRSSAAFVIH